MDKATEGLCRSPNFSVWTDSVPILENILLRHSIIIKILLSLCMDIILYLVI